MELIYTARHTGFEKGKRYRNPRYFDRVEPAATSVIIEGDFPAVKEAYEKADVKVTEADAKPVKAAQSKSGAKPAQSK